jgi:hypothetical protein
LFREAFQDRRFIEDCRGLSMPAQEKCSIPSQPLACLRVQRARIGTSKSKPH